MKIIMVRHGETVENTKHIIMGHRHGTLSRKGRAQARAVARKLRNQRIDVIFSSDLGRARETAKQIARYHRVPVVYTKALRAVNTLYLQAHSV
jgi:broad specificity phosphatase PhoE